ncbi:MULTISPECIES: cytochrome P450 [unclassified Mycobacterium]|uniref:cytochrome P450 n=1 Tax=unclassified Mycobacterium TaxID=2642494 RepID=UPI00074002C5|nr:MULTISPECIES: cytochrome P450 [unclassified Mycobacterium]KUH80177.1 cytochrome [Mycobacterium sp. GA-0227b]KUH81729.1 cytochrome [Mycobacterium sp. GA-1999]KUH94009.1 cytochrome [Mycobacterium sp. IS-1556]
MTTDFDSVDYFTDPSLVPDPHPYYDHIRSKDPICCPINNGVLAVTGWEAANSVYKDSENFSSCVAVMGPFTPMPFTPEGDDICEQLEKHRTEIPMFEHMVTMDPPQHTDARSILARLLTPKRLKENEDFMWRLADRHIDEFIADGKCEFLAAYAKPFSLLVVADLLGVPEEDHEAFRESFGAQRPGSNIGGLDHEVIATNPLEWADEKFARYIEERRESPRDDVLTSIATAKYPDGSTPEVVDVVRTATFLFAAGQETTAKLLGAAMRVLSDRPDIQQQLRDDRSLIPIFIEECLRMDSPVKSVFRMARKTTALGDTPVPAGTTVMVSPGAANRDPRRFDNPHEFSLDRKNVREHIAFSRGIHSCPGAPLARVEGRVSIERILDRMADITVSEEKHGPIDARRYVYEPTFILRGLTEINIEFKPIG